MSRLFKQACSALRNFLKFDDGSFLHLKAKISVKKKKVDLEHFKASELCPIDTYMPPTPLVKVFKEFGNEI